MLNRLKTSVGVRVSEMLVNVVFMLACVTAHAVAPPLPSLDQYQRTSWGAKEGAPAGVWAIAQTSDGWLWFGGPTGLYRFDGIRFTHMELEPAGSTRSDAVSALFAMDFGPLLIGRRDGGISIFEGGRVRDYSYESKTAATVLAFALDADGVPWAGTLNGMLRFDGTSWAPAISEWNLPEARFEALLLDHAGNLWASTATEVMHLPHGERRFRFDSIPVANESELFESPDGRAWVADTEGAHLLPGQVADGRYDSMANSRSSHWAIFSHDLRFWRTTSGGNERHAAIPGGISGVESLPGLPTTMLEDREGNVWVGTTGNFIHRLHRKVLTQVPSPAFAGMGGGIGVEAGDDGIAWMASNTGGNFGSLSPHDGLFRYNSRVTKRIIGPPNAIAIKRAVDGAIWLAGGKGLWRKSGSRFTQLIELPDAHSAAYVRGFAVDASGNPWVSLIGFGLFRHVDGYWERNGNLPSLPAFEPTVLDYDAAGRLWLGYRDGSVMTVDRNVARVVGTAAQTRVGAVTALSLGSHVLIGGDRGMTVLRDGQAFSLKARGGFGFGIVTGIVQTAQGDVWVNCTPGAVRITAAQFDGPIVQGNLDVSAELFDNVDGYPGKGTNTSAPLPSMTAAPDGKIWLAGTAGIAWFDPKAMGTRFDRPRAYVESVTTDGHLSDATPPASLAKGTRDIRFDYTAFDFTHPERLQFRYRLDGYDKEWVEGGSRRQAFYTNLGPATYRFEVQAANETGLWSERSSSVDIEIPPTFTQTRVFFALCAAGGVLFLALLYRIRVRQLTVRERVRLQDRTGERERIARELHDTLLQSTQGLMLKFQMHAQEIAADSPARIDLEQTLRSANEVMTEGRDRVQDLRLAAETAGDLPKAIAAIGEQLAAGTTTSFSVVSEGRVRDVKRVVREEGYRVAREALLNAFRHAQACSIEAQIIFEETTLRIRIRDDGRGIDAETLDARGTAGHWGMKGMQERAREMGATLDVWSRPGGGTEIELAVPANLAYRRGRGRASFAWPPRWWT